MKPSRFEDLVVAEIDRSFDEILDLAGELIRVPTINPPGELYDVAARVLGDRLAGWGFEVEYLTATGRPEHSDQYPRANVLASVGRTGAGPGIHLNGHLDVVPPGEGWTTDPFSGDVRDGRLHGRGSVDMKSGLTCAAFAVEALRRVDAPLPGLVQVSGTADEESGGFAGAAHLAETGRVSADRTAYAIIPEPFGPTRISVGHRGVYWFRVRARGQVAHGSMPFLGRSAVDDLTALLEGVRTELKPRIEGRVSDMPVVPQDARRGSINVNAVRGGQIDDGTQTPCVADVAEAVFDRRFLFEESFESVRDEVESLIARLEDEDPERSYELEDLMHVPAVRTPEGSPLVDALEGAVEAVTGVVPERVASPGTYDQKHLARIGGIWHCVAYGPGDLERAHQVDESCDVEDLRTVTKAIALTMLRLPSGSP